MIEGFKIPQVNFRIREGDISDNEIACAIGGKWTNKSTDDFFKNKKVILLPSHFLNDELSYPNLNKRTDNT